MAKALPRGWLHDFTLRRQLGAVALLFLSAAVAYLPALNGGILWDDSGHVTKPALQSLHGLFRIWFEVGATQQYYPLLHSAFWIEHRVWGDAVLGYHLTNVALHALSACLVVAIMRRLALPGAWLAGFLFALHPVCTESVAWISEQKNTLSTAFYLGSALYYLRFDRDRKRSSYVAALALYVLALLSKSVTATLPVTLLVVLWWEWGRLTWKRDVVPLLPWLAIGATSGLVTAWVERAYIGARGAGFDLSFGGRCLLAGRAIWFYLGKLFWPSNLIFIYPRWRIDSGEGWQYLFPLGAVGLAAGLWMLSRKNRGPLAAFLCFVAALAPALGFVEVYPFVYSYVADHFQYQAALTILIPAASGLTIAARRLAADRRLATALAAMLVGALGVLTWRQCGMYRGEETLFRETIARNPECWMAYNNLGILLAGQIPAQPGRASEAIEQFRKALEVRPDFAEARLNLGNVLADFPGRLPEAIANYREAIRLSPNLAPAYYALAVAEAKMQGGLEDSIASYRTAIRLSSGDGRAHRGLAVALSVMPGQLPEAIAEFRKAMAIDGSNAQWHFELAVVLAQTPGQTQEAIGEYRSAIEIKPDYAEAHLNLGGELLRMPGGADQAISEFQTALRLRPHYAEAHYDLGNALSEQPGRMKDAIAEYEAALRDRPDYPDAHCNLGIALAEMPGRLADAFAQFDIALRLDPRLAEAHYAWGVALASVPGKANEAVAHFRAALRARPDFAPAREVLARLHIAQ